MVHDSFTWMILNWVKSQTKLCCQEEHSFRFPNRVVLNSGPATGDCGILSHYVQPPLNYHLMVTTHSHLHLHSFVLICAKTELEQWTFHLFYSSMWHKRREDKNPHLSLTFPRTTAASECIWKPAVSHCGYGHYSSWRHKRKILFTGPTTCFGLGLIPQFHVV